MHLRRRFVAMLLVPALFGAALVGCVINDSPTPYTRLPGAVGYNAAPLYNPDDPGHHEIEAVADLGAKWLRGDFNWPTIERNGRGQFQWGSADRLVDDANRLGIRLLGQITYVPQWAKDTNGLPTDADFANYAQALAVRYAPRGVHHWEIWNEANLRGPWPGAPDPVKYTAMLKAAWVAIHAVDPTATVVTSGLAPAGNVKGYSIPPATFVRRMYELGARSYIDAVGLHPYSGRVPAATDVSWNVMIQARDAVYPVMREFHDSTKKIWATESGYTTNGDETKAVSEAEQGQRIIEMIQTWLSYPFAGPIFVYGARDAGTDPTNWHDGFGVLRRNFVPKAAYAELRDFLHPTPPTTTTSEASSTTTEAPPSSTTELATTTSDVATTTTTSPVESPCGP